ncbi:uncharacterized protein MELLADRAFT_105875 [Melampsora larici-populina 98AG31]|uniref:Uncharacterized protein n=1 Tax=Melampsora larici-populina (strain 98AG31 / pathotype 3-4-7) TaxID=747676 RepID=F4RJL9_MELLP|nr:uncharacterized protein MELLADRAFT_105875 [Melampsora larici-populina 98AG31]EGG07466.1 hypothetical protein MELLADRAFT_105875 [Melampsora larici-populina 98AG31]
MSSSSPNPNLPVGSKNNLNLHRIQLLPTSCKPTRMDTGLQECEVEKTEGSLRQRLWNSNQRAKRVLSRIFPKSSTLSIPKKSSSLSVNVVDDNINELGSPPDYEDIDHDVCGQSSLVPAPIHLTDDYVSGGLNCSASPCLIGLRNIPSGTSRIEHRHSVSHCDRRHVSSSPLRRPATPSVHSTRQETTQKTSSRSGSTSHPISASRRARQARRDLQAAKKSLPVLTQKFPIPTLDMLKTKKINRRGMMKTMAFNFIHVLII